MIDKVYINERVGIVPRGYPLAEKFVNAKSVCDDVKNAISMIEKNEISQIESILREIMDKVSEGGEE